ncbi:trypsin V-A-like [Zootermopsis nevadensis]|uniref:trypsin V-A-like n=1 Tax=Zootermopsis nevadensis TaxID=136037 RepID=UPI000B8E581F|nr:trypsin V-A-like [Zootermopsis nevadensis]
MGEHNLDENEGTELEFRVERAVTHPGYDADTVDNDVALLRLPAEVRPDKYWGFACLPRYKQELPPAQQLCTIIGWGKRRSGDPFGTDVLHEATVPIVASNVCRRVYMDYHITENMFCAGYEKGRKDSCAGDSGGPLLCKDDRNRWTIFGITSFGEGCGKRGKFGIYTKLPNYVKWIHSWINKV